MSLNLDFITRDNPQAINEFVSNTWRPAFFGKDGRPYGADKRPVANAMLGREQWENIDQAVIKMARLRLNAWQDVISAGAVTTTTLAEWLSTWKVSSEMEEADVTMDFETQTSEDRTERKHYSVPLPIISKSFSYGRREILTAERFGANLETNEAEEAAQSVAEKLEEILIDGNSNIVLEGNSIDGYTSITGRYSDTAEGDFGTIDNIYPTFTGLVKTLGDRRFRGPFMVYMHSTQFTEMLDIYSDGTGDSALDRVLRIPQIAGIKINDQITAGEIVAVQLTKDVVDIRKALALETRRWEKADGSRVWFKVMVAAVPRIKINFNGYTGIAHLTGA